MGKEKGKFKISEHRMKIETIKWIGYGASLTFMFLLYFLPDTNYAQADFKNGWLEGVALMIGISSIIVVVGIVTGVKFGTKKDYFELIKSIFYEYHKWGVMQQGLFLSIFVAIEMHNFNLAYWLCIGVFSLSHFPNIFLIMLTAVSAMLFFPFMVNEGNILIPFIAHGLIGSFAYRFIPHRIHGGFAIWMDYIRDQRKKNAVIYK